RCPARYRAAAGPCTWKAEGPAGVGDSHIEGAAAEDKDRQPWSRQCIGERSGGPGSGSQQSSGLRGGL
ncbi:hypothetical protein COCSUDRAFT_47823, partial [Coccomyxa subellipsoidea C-169]